MARSDPHDTKIDRYRQFVIAQWTDPKVILAWTKWHDTRRQHLRELTQALLAEAGLFKGAHLLDLGCGTGEPAIPLALAVGDSGRVTAIDLSEGLLRTAEAEAAKAGLKNFEVFPADVHRLPFADATFDLATSRLSSVYFVEIGLALSEILRVLRPGGRFTALAWGMPEQGNYFATCALPFVMRADVGAPSPDSPSPVRFAPPGALAVELTKAGFSAVRERRTMVDLEWPGSPEVLWQQFFETSVTMRPIFEGLPRDQFEEAYYEAMAALERLYDGTTTRNTAEVVLVSGIKP